MNAVGPAPRRIAVIGGGIAGLAAAQRLSELDSSREIALCEASDRLGGVLDTERRDGFLIERSADMFTTRDPWALDLCRRIGFADQLIETNAAFRRAFVVRRGRLHPVPAGFTLMSPARLWPIVTSPLLGPAGKLRLIWEYFTPAKKDNADESLQSFAERRFGRQAFQRLIQPLIGGIYTADPTQLSMAATMPQFLEMERQRGSLIRAMRHAAGQQQHADDRLLESGARYGLFVAPRDGMSSLVSAIVARLPAGCVQLQAPVHRLQQQPNGQWKIEFAASADCPPRDGRMFDAVVLAVPAPHAAQLIRSVSGELSSLLTKIPHASAAVVITGYRREQVQHPLDGFGFVVPAMENRRILATSFASVKYAGRAPAGQVLLRTFVGGACQPELLERDDAAIKQMVAAELSELLGVRGAPLLCEVVRWTSAMPQYHVGHLQLVEQIERCAAGIANFALAGNAFRGVGIPFCIHSGERAAERLLRGIMPTQS